MSKPKGVYLIQEKGCLNPQTGAYQHISMGAKHLASSFNIKVYLGLKQISLNSFEQYNNQKTKSSLSKKNKIKGVLYGTLKDIQILFKNLFKTYKLIKSLKTVSPQFVYERVSYLDFSGLLACKYLRIPHFYEANGFQYRGRKRYYKSVFIKISKFLEKKSYTISNHVFFVGSYGDYWGIKKKNWTNVENGIEEHLIINSEQKEIENKDVFDICFVGRLMDHQKIGVFVQALSITQCKSQIRINLIGSGLDGIEADIKKLNIKVVNHGFVDRDNIVKLLSDFDLAIISGSNSYQSCMKLFDYAAAGCAVIAPDIHNLKLWFSDELLFFDGTSKGLSQLLEDLVNNENNKIKSFGKKLNMKVKKDFTWKEMFNKKSEIIKSYLH
ncbi:MAG: hypothetical protein CMC76_02835 [Flavobacteriaceae bacterium]|nr:hypothetical protein [Flavobacteriaceae bacterium]|tara:strand:+ start:3183 stop:4331 length:1149 start_codon:yes stop_codon:yes gene_type:complete